MAGLMGNDRETALGPDVPGRSLYRCGEMTLPQIVEKLSLAPAKILGVPAGTLAEGAAADIVAFDPDEAWTPRAEALRSNSKNCAVLGRTLHGRVRLTLCGGKIVFER